MAKKLYCPECDNEVKEGENFCSRCGYEFRDDIKSDDTEKSNKTMVISIILVAAVIFLIVYLFLNPKESTDAYTKLYSDGKLSKVAEDGDTILEKKDANDKIWEVVIASNYRTGEKEKSEKLIKEFIDKDMKNAENTVVVATLGNLAFDEGDFSTAIDAYDNSLIKLSGFDKDYAAESAQKYIRSYIILGDYNGGLNKIDELSRILGADTFTSVKNELMQAKLKHENKTVVSKKPEEPKAPVEKIEEKPEEPKIEERDVNIAPIEDATIIVDGTEVYKSKDFIKDNDKILVPLKETLKVLESGLEPGMEIDILQIFMITDNGANSVNIEEYADDLKNGDTFIIGFVKDSGIVSGEFTIGSDQYADISPEGADLDLTYEMNNKVVLEDGEIYMSPQDINEYIYPIIYKMEKNTLTIESDYK